MNLQKDLITSFWYYYGATILFANIAIWDFMLLTGLFVRNVF